MANDRLHSSLSSADMGCKEVDKLKQNELKMAKEVNALKLELNEMLDKFERQKEDYNAQIDLAESKISNLSELLDKVRLEASENERNAVEIIARLKEETAIASAQSSVNVNEVAEATVVVVEKNNVVEVDEEMREKLEVVEKSLQLKTVECEKLEERIKENEMKIKLLDDLREKDTKQHVKSMLFLLESGHFLKY